MGDQKKKIRRIVEEQDTAWGRWFDYFIQFLIVLSLIAFPFQTVDGLDPIWKGRLQIFEDIVIMIFVIEFLLRFWVATSWKTFWSTPWPYIDLLAVAPTLLSRFVFGGSLDLRWLRIFRIFKLMRYFESARDRFILAFQDIWKELVVFLLFAVGLIYIAAVLLYIVEKGQPNGHFNSVFDGLWWAGVTLTTVGYGDMVPVTAVGKALTFFILIIGLGIIAVPSGLLASGLTKAHQKIDTNSD